MKLGHIVLLLLTLLLSGCDEHAWNDPYPKESPTGNILYTAFTVQPKLLDPARSYSENEYTFIMQIYEPPLEYNYLLRPYTVQALTAEALPVVRYDAKTNRTHYTIKIKPGIMYQPHPAFAADADGKFYYHNLTYTEGIKHSTLFDFKHTGSRELKAADYVYQIKRLADPKIGSPAYGMLSIYIIGMEELRKNLSAAYKNSSPIQELDLRNFELAGARVIDDYTYEIIINGKFPQFMYWLAMSFFAPMPWEAIVFYNQPGLQEHNISINWYPVGTGPFYLTENNPERRMVMQRNPNFHAEYYPTTGMPEDAESGLLKLAGQRLPFVDKIIFSLEKENIPYWDKFLQGYYDASGISSDSFNSVIRLNAAQNLALSPELEQRKYRLRVSSMPTVVYWGFNLLDPVLGGYTDSAKKLRKAISLAFDIDEYIAIFLNGRAVAADAPIPPGLFGYNKLPQRAANENLTQAKQLLAEAGYADGINHKTGQPLTINFDIMGSGDPGEQARLAWIRKQVAKLGIELIIRSSDYNRYQEKMNTGNAQMYMWAWGADYPDPENFLALFYGPNGKVKFDGENASNYSNAEFDNLYEKFKALENTPQRSILIEQMLQILREDAPWIWGYFPQAFGLYSPWYNVTKPSGVINNTLKYVKIDPEMRAKLRNEWNQPLLWPIAALILFVLIVALPAIIAYKRVQNATGRRLN